MTRALRWTLISAPLVLALTLLILGCPRTGSEAKEERKREATVKPQSPASVRDGQTLVTLQPDTQARLGLRMASLTASARRAEERAIALVLPVEELGELSNGYAAAVAKVEKARANLDVSRKEYERLQGLYADNQNASAKAMEAAQGTFRSDEAELRAVERGVTLQQNSVQQRWGAVMADWVARNSPALRRLFEQREFLVQITLPSGPTSQAPRTAALELPSGGMGAATFVSPFPRLDPRIQGTSFLYSTPAKPGLAAGMNLTARLDHGNARKGVVVPEAAVVWWQGRAWVYVQTEANTFARRALPTQSQIAGGLFVTQGFSPGDKVVIEGAESLLSAELGSQVSGEQGEQ